jgi:hypothetical protein
MWCRVALVRIDVSEERIPFNLQGGQISELRTTLAVTNNRSTLQRDPFRSSDVSKLILAIHRSK